jgi:DNA-directed RNA polymerase specialized sigma24 family protein
LLITITARKAAHRVRDEGRHKRRGGNPEPPNSEPMNIDLDQILGQEPSPDFAAQVAEEYQRLLESLGDAELRSIALWRMEGHTSKEIATKLNCVPRTVERRLQLIRSLWKKEIGP